MPETRTNPTDVNPDDPIPAPADPGGAHAKGFSADPRPGAAAGDQEPVPLAPVPDDGLSHVQQPERQGQVQPTGRSEPHDYTPNDRLMGADR